MAEQRDKRNLVLHILMESSCQSQNAHIQPFFYMKMYTCVLKLSLFWVFGHMQLNLILVDIVLCLCGLIKLYISLILILNTLAV